MRTGAGRDLDIGHLTLTLERSDPGEFRPRGEPDGGFVERVCSERWFGRQIAQI
jgi:hypothetical protein